MVIARHCERSEAPWHLRDEDGLLRCARNDGATCASAVILNPRRALAHASGFDRQYTHNNCAGKLAAKASPDACTRGDADTARRGGRRELGLRAPESGS